MTSSSTTTMNQQQQQPPAHFICPLTKQVMEEPMMSRYGTSFERKAILQWLAEGHNYCPVSHKPLRPSNLISDKTLKFKIQSWAKQNDYKISSAAIVTDDESDVSRMLGDNTKIITIPSDRFICPITKKLMEDPVMTKTGVNYERKALLKHLNKNGYTCPVTGKGLKPSGVIANSKLSWEIQQWNLYHGSADTATSGCGSKLSQYRATRSSPLFTILKDTNTSTMERAGLKNESKDLTDILDDVMATLHF